MTSWYSGAPDECSQCYWGGEIVKISECRKPEHSGYGFTVKIDGVTRYVPCLMPSAEFLAKIGWPEVKRTLSRREDQIEELRKQLA